MWFVAQHSRAPRCERGRCRFKSDRSTQLNAECGMWISECGIRLLANKIPHSTFRTPHFSGAVAERRMHFTVDEDDDGSSPFGPAIGTPASLPARLYGRLAETDQRRFEEPKSLARYQERPPFFRETEDFSLLPRRNRPVHPRSRPDRKLN